MTSQRTDYLTQKTLNPILSGAGDMVSITADVAAYIKFLIHNRPTRQELDEITVDMPFLKELGSTPRSQHVIQKWAIRATTAEINTLGKMIASKK